ncbi:hypothetical protein N7495_007168 [Penicillium taxi]|uniref:uncharacterized protein n=1 Tax=Penicillium taxi TaxID=168475 RepID=UPI00254586EB|nr:uncharacterized protein N7495_007168 [Penicillium taxi]KAJ5895477.1 hypothetical protein N7495_007168 [Penicillium taxi]
MAGDGNNSRGFASENGWRPAEPASSIIAAHFAPRLASQVHESHRLSRETFSQLRQELLGERQGQLRVDEGITDINKLICIVLKAGLETSPSSSVAEDDLEGQVLDCLDIIQASVDKAPQALWELSDPLILGEDVQAPLFAWLILRLIKLASLWPLGTIHQRISLILGGIPIFQYKQIRSSSSSYGGLAFLRACRSDIICSIETVAAQADRGAHSLELSIPAVNGSLLEDLDNLNLPRGLLKSPIVLGTFPNALLLASLLLDSSSGLSVSKRVLTRRQNFMLRQNFPWVLSEYYCLREAAVTWMQKLGPKLTLSEELVFVKLLDDTRDFCMSEPSSSKLLSDMSVTSALTRCLTNFLIISIHHQLPTLQRGLSLTLDDILQNSKSFIQKSREEFLSVLAKVKNREDSLQSVESCLSITLRSLNAELADTPNRDAPQFNAPSEDKEADLSLICQKTDVPDDEDEEMEDSRPRKRPRLSAEPADKGLLQQLTTALSLMLKPDVSPTSPEVRLAALTQPVLKLFEGLSEDQKTTFYGIMGKMPCIMRSNFTQKSSETTEWETIFCNSCDGEQSPENDMDTQERLYAHIELGKNFQFTLKKLTRTPGPRIAAMLALRRILKHMPQVTPLSKSPYGEFCLQSLRSSIRELRVAAGYSVATFIRSGFPQNPADNHLATRRANFVIILEWLKNLNEKKDIPLQEVCILTLCCLAKVSGEEEKNIILLRLLEYLGHPNPYVCAVAYNEISKLAQQVAMTPAGLFRPYWRTLSVAVVKNLQSRPYMAEQLCEMLGMNVDSFLNLTEIHVLPYLVLTRKREIISRIGASRPEGKVETPFDVCSEKNNLAAILAFLLSQETDNPEVMIMSLLAEIDPAFKGRTLAELVRIEPILIACDLLKSLGGAGEHHKERFHQALRSLAMFVPRKFSHGNSSKKGDLSHFIEEHVLGIITQFANAINDFQVRQTLAEKRRNLKAIEEMINIAEGHVSNALPQVCACLRSALEIEELCDQAFSAWKTLIGSLSEEDIEPLVDQTFAIVIRYWSRLTEESRKYAHQLIEHILTKHPNLVRDTFDTMPSLASIPEMAAFEEKINSLRSEMDVRSMFSALIRRCQSENSTVVEQALSELLPFLQRNDEFLHLSAISEQPDPVIAQLTRALLDCCVKFNTSSESITLLTARCLGLVGCLDPNRVETVKEKKDILVLSNFDRTEEIDEFVLFFLQNVLVEAFLSASNTRAQGFLAYAMQGLLNICQFNTAVVQCSRGLDGDHAKYRRWMALPESIRNTLTPFLTSTYTVTIIAPNPRVEYPMFSPEKAHSDWLRTLVQDLLQAENGGNAKLIFSVCNRVVKGQDISISSFLLPFAVLNRIVGGTEQECKDIRLELSQVLEHPLPDTNNNIRETIISSSQSVFEVLDYLSRWLQGKKKQINGMGNQSSGRSKRGMTQDLLYNKYSAQIKSVESLLASIPPEIISKRAVECKSYSRALFHWEQYIRKCNSQADPQEGSNPEILYQRLQDIYSQIDEPDGIEGISSHLPGLNIDQQVLEHRKAGRWATAQSWYELQLEKEPENSEAQWNLVTCLRESGQQDAILTRFEALKDVDSATSRFLPFAVEASWITSRWTKLQSYLKLCEKQGDGDFNVGMGSALHALGERKNSKDEVFHLKTEEFTKIVNQLRLNIAKSLTANSVTSLQSCHDDMLRLHALADMEAIANAETGSIQAALSSNSDLPSSLKRRLDVIGGYVTDKQYLLGIRRATMELSGGFVDSDISAAWLTSAHLSRKGNFIRQAYHSMLNAARLKDRSATIEHAKLLWRDGHHRKAIQTLEGAISANEAIQPPSASRTTSGSVDPGSATILSGRVQNQNDVPARAHLMLAKWTDRAGQTHSQAIVQRYREAIKLYPRWEKAHYYLGKHYNKILDSEKAKPMGKEAQIYLSGEATKLVIDNYLRSLTYGSKYVFQTLPKLLTLWLEHASIVGQPIDPKRGDNADFQRHTKAQRQKSLDDMHAQLKKYISNRLQPALLFTILPQVVARICHPNTTVYDLLTRIVVKSVYNFPQQGLWTVLAVVKSSNKDRASKGFHCLQKITDYVARHKTAIDIRRLINQGQKFSEELLSLCLVHVEDRVTRVQLSRDLRFNHKVAPCRLVVPFQAMLIPSLPASHDSEYLKGFRPFPGDATTIEAVLDEAQILSSLQKPRRISIRGSDGKIYNVLCKPKDDLRKDQRLMEFNNMINRFLKRDVQSSKRRMYIKTYAVTPLNEECGLIEWVNNLRTLREIVLKLLREKGIPIVYNDIKQYMNEVCNDKTFSKLELFTTKILDKLPPVLHEWFIEMFPETEAWFTARLRYTRSTAVMSMVGYVLGLGDRHGENLSFEEETGGILHVDFNCLFDKGQTFEKPEVVPFRLTQNMVDAFGAYGYNGPFRRTCEITLNLLRQNEDALMTVLETFLYDPTTDFIEKRRRNRTHLPDTPAGVLEDVRNKLRGFMSKQPIPLSVDGQVDELIIQATDKKALAQMYIGWCPFF